MSSNLIMLMELVFLGFIPGWLTYIYKTTGGDTYRILVIYLTFGLAAVVGLSGVKPEDGPQLPIQKNTNPEFGIIQDVLGLFGLVGIFLLFAGPFLGWSLGSLKKK
jgi:hypothetical protein